LRQAPWPLQPQKTNNRDTKPTQPDRSPPNALAKNVEIVARAMHAVQTGLAADALAVLAQHNYLASHRG
jgi:hypothetical protein